MKPLLKIILWAAYWGLVLCLLRPVPVRSEWREVRWTGFCPCKRCTGKACGYTASGARFKAGMVAADPSLPFGSQVWAFGRWHTVEDRGGAIRGNRMDLGFSSHRAAKEFGVQVVRTWVPQPSPGK